MAVNNDVFIGSDAQCVWYGIDVDNETDSDDEIVFYLGNRQVHSELYTEVLTAGKIQNANRTK